MNILEEAETLINGDRAKDYGPVTENFERIADLWTTYVGDVVPFTAFDVSNMMILVKVARVRSGSRGVGTGFHRDSYVDVAGYAALAERCWDEIDTGRAISEYIATGKTEPRVWGSLVDVPIVSRVTDNEGDVWSFSSGRWYWTDNRTGVSHDEGDEPLNTFDEDGPFTEVLS